MTRKKITYRCEACGESVKIIDGEMMLPECCEMPMKQVAETDIDFCKKSMDPEHARFEDDDSPCDDGRSGKI